MCGACVKAQMEMLWACLIYDLQALDPPKHASRDISSQLGEEEDSKRGQTLYQSRLAFQETHTKSSVPCFIEVSSQLLTQVSGPDLQEVVGGEGLEPPTSCL